MYSYDQEDARHFDISLCMDYDEVYVYSSRTPLETTKNFLQMTGLLRELCAGKMKRSTLVLWSWICGGELLNIAVVGAQCGVC